MFSLKIDSASRLDRSVLGINVQFIENNKIQIKTLAMTEVKIRHTSANISQIVIDVLTLYNLNINQVYTITTDNGANMLKAAILLGEDQNVKNVVEENRILLIEEDEDENETEEEEEFFYNHSYFITNDFLIDMEYELRFSNDNSQKDFLKVIRCAAHTLQLTIGDIMKDLLFKETLEKARQVVKKLRTNTVLNLLKIEKFRKPILDCITRWSSSYRMCLRLLELKSFCTKFSVDFDELHLTADTWNKIDIIVTILKPANETFMSLQHSQLTLGDFFSAWTICKLKVLKINNEFSNIFITALDKRSSKIMQSDPMMACMYLDPRYQILLSDAQKIQAKAHLLKIYLYVSKYLVDEPEIENDTISEVVSNSACEEEVNELEQMMKTIENDKQQDLLNTNQPNCIINNNTNDIIGKIQSFDNIKRVSVSANFNILDFWQNYSVKELCDLAKIVFAVPATQVTVERAFSTLKFILSDKRSNIEDVLLEDILLINLNSK